MAAADAQHAWAVGSEDYSPQRPDASGVPVIQRWDGSAWSRETMPEIKWHGALRLVAADSPSSVWAVGSSTSTSIDDTVTHVLHYAGVNWREVPFPLGNKPSSMQITGLSASQGHAWLVGNQGSKVIIQEWDGQVWQARQPPAQCLPNGASAGAMPTFCNLTAIIAFAADNVWAAGNGAWSGFQGPLVFHWDGTDWRAIQVGINNQQFAFTAIGGRSAADMWVVGNLFNSAVSLAVHREGTTWRVVKGVPNTLLTGVTQDAAGRPWVLGNSPAPDAIITTYSGGRSWIDTAAPRPPGALGITLTAIAAVPRTPRMFAVGYADLPTEPRTVTAVILEYSAPESTLAPDGRA